MDKSLQSFLQQSYANFKSQPRLEDNGIALVCMPTTDALSVW